jgi:HEAT repeat protein
LRKKHGIDPLIACGVIMTTGQHLARLAGPTCSVILIASWLALPVESADAGQARSISLTLTAQETISESLGCWKAGRTYRLVVTLQPAHSGPNQRVKVELNGPGNGAIRKTLHAGDPDFYLAARALEDGPAAVTLSSDNSSGDGPVSVGLEWAEIPLSVSERSAIEAEPNDSWRQANPLVLGRDVYGTADDVDYLANLDEGKAGLDWFRFEVAGEKPVLVYFQLDLLDRDVSANLRVYAVDPKAGRAEPYVAGKDPMEIVHDRERERYSKHISRTFTKGTYYLEVNANHPDYILRTRVLPVPPFDDPQQAVEAGMHYIMNVGDAWFAQVPREGNIFVRADNIHDTATRCTACHASSFPTEANLAAHRAGYPIRSKSNMLYVMDRIANSITPLYGEDGLYWQRFIAIPLQSQGKQGGILADFEREVAGREFEMVERFAPFLKAAWQDRHDMPADELNGVLPLDSKFGLAWRDWRVLKEVARRTGREDYRRAAENIAAILGERAADRRIETLQDRIHRLHAWWLMDKERFANKIRRETGALLVLQNPDGGWYESDSKPGPSAVYTTGQLVDTLLEIGLSRDHPAIARALRYLLFQQQDFGGWFQTTTHENFRTPMRETRYVVMALARAFPRPGAPLASWGNRDDRPPRLPRTDTVVNTLDDLENLWDVPAADRPRYAIEIARLLDHPEPLVRASAAACLGRLGRAEAVPLLVKHLGDPSKIVWRAAAWGLRRLGNQGIGIDAILSALHDPDARIRRGATRVFAYQFHGMDTRPDIAHRLIELTRDPDLWTRLQALRTLRQWFYRTGDRGLQRRIVDAYLARMARPELPVIRKNLSEGLYITLDENLGGGTSLQKNLAELPEAIRPRILEARKALERDVLLTPVLAALESGNLLQRQAVLRSFDGSFFKGRFYARQPENMIDVGNDREFGFLYEPPLDVLERTFRSLLTFDMPADSRRDVIRLCSFFKLTARTKDATIQSQLLRALGDADAGVREASATVVRGELSLIDLEGNRRQVRNLARMLIESRGARPALLAAIGRNPGLAADPEIVAAIRKLLDDGEPAAELLPVLGHRELSDSEVLTVLDRGWDGLTPPQRATALEILFGRATILDRSDPPEPLVHLLRRAITDASAAVREKALQGMDRIPPFWSGRTAAGLLLGVLADDSPALRKLGLAMSATNAPFWDRPDAREHLARLLIDPDASVRSEALELVKHHRVAARSPALARRVKALADDPALSERALAVLRAAGLDPADVKTDLGLARPRLLNLATFRSAVNPLFYQAGEDGYACAKCHANHTILRIAEADPSRGFSSEQLMLNYTSALKVVNLGEPASSLILRKPLSPQGQGTPEDSSPTGLTHVGGPRWKDTEHPAYRAILAWIREAQSAAAGAESSAKLSADSHSPGFEPARAGDGEITTVWQTEFVGATPGYPHELTIDLGAPRTIDGLLYIPRQDSPGGRVKDFEVRVSTDGKTWAPPLARGSWPDDATFKHVALPGPVARFVQLRGLSEVGGQSVMSAAELAVDYR